MRYASIRKMDISNGEELGVALFVQGCHFHCYNCFNKETWDFDSGKEFTKDIKEKFYKLIDKPYIKRISILGGEPLCDENIPDVCGIINYIDILYPDKKIWIYTGYKWEDLFPPIALDWFDISDVFRKDAISRVDVLVDGSYIDKLKDFNYPWAGSTNQRVIDVQKSLKNGEVVLWDSKS